MQTQLVSRRVLRPCSVSRTPYQLCVIRSQRPQVFVRTATEDKVEVSTNGTGAAAAPHTAVDTPANLLDFDELSEIIKLVQSTDITEFEMKSSKFHLSVRKKEAVLAEHALNLQKFAASLPQLPQQAYAPAPAAAAAAPASAAPAPAAAPAAAPAPAKPPAASAPKGIEVTSPMSGTFYRSPAPGEPMFVKEGDRVKKGQTVGIIEAMKLMNEIEAEVAGEVVKILAENGQPISPGQPIMLIKP